MKKILSVLMVFVICFGVMGGDAFAQGDGIEKSNSPVVLSSLSDGETMNFIKSKGIEVPEDLKNNPNLGQFIKSIIKEVETSPEWIAPYSYTVTRDFALEIKDAVNTHYGIAKQDKSEISLASSYILQDSTVVYYWTDSYYKYNCYGHAINQTSRYVNPGYYSGLSFSLSLSINSMANLVVNDLNALGFSSYTTSIRPTNSSLAVNEKAIAIRKGSTDYHFMKLGSNVWTHKPGGTAVLHYNYIDPGQRIWSNERYAEYDTYAPNVWYDSSVVYIVYWEKNGPIPELS